MGNTCSPIYILSTSGFQQLSTNPDQIICPVCYTKLTTDNFVNVGPKQNVQELDVEFSSKANITIKLAPIISATSNTHYKKPIVSTPVSQFRTDNKILIFMNGVIGSGKTTASGHFKNRFDAMNIKCEIVGTDKYCIGGKSIGDAIGMVREKLIELGNTNDNTVVILDTCNDRKSKNECFGYNISKWKKYNFWPNLTRCNASPEYLAWSLRNVLMRPKSTPESDFWINPIDVDYQKCIEVHKRKFTAIFGKNAKYLTIKSNNSADLISELNEAAITFQSSIDDIETQISQFIGKKIKDVAWIQ